jgi:hypothetical protein
MIAAGAFVVLLGYWLLVRQLVQREGGKVRLTPLDLATRRFIAGIQAMTAAMGQPLAEVMQRLARAMELWQRAFTSSIERSR